MSDAPAAPVPENGVPPVAQDSGTSAVTPGFKVTQFPSNHPLPYLNFLSIRSLLEILRIPLRMKG